MKKMISLAVMLSCALSSLAWADGPNGNGNPGQQQVWQNGSGHGSPDGNRQQGPGNNGPQGNGDSHRQGADNRGSDRHNPGDNRAIIMHKGSRIRNVMNKTTLRGTGMTSVRGNLRRSVIAGMIIGSATGTIAACRRLRRGSTGRILTATMS